MDRLGCRRQAISLLVNGVEVIVPGDDAVSCSHSGLQAARQGSKVFAEVRLDWRDRVVAEQALIGVVKQLAQRFGLAERLQWPELLPQHQYEQAMLCD